MKHSVSTGKLRKSCIFALLVLLLIAGAGYRALTSLLAERYIAALSWALADKLIVIDPGHGGDDPGAVGSKGVHEKDIVLDVSKKLGAILRQAGAEVVLTRETDHDLAGITGNYSYRSKIEDLTRRVAIANEKQADLFISIHVNSFPDPREKGAQTFSQPGSAAGKQLAKAIQQELNNHLQNSGRQDKQVDYFTNRMAKMPSTIVEIGFISNPGEESLMLNPQYQQKIAWSIYAGIARYLAEPKAAMSPYIR
ncbi:MAG: N-acetylmuramoyl-L-alanine amidase [Pelotomaculum thermopropionicum]|uniref:N-acetylmuramoyl-L-alanine amidase n=1 Tax=Pelotomaculum thermopropionicum TaxID=110500 RepID=A0A101HTN7_9FIRM|nr:MAG: N-acetylmuramoyl-L-alanine amidase [Pelotomaculum thermopropionicum]